MLTRRKTQKATSVFTVFNEPWLLFNYKWKWTEEKQKYRWFLHDENKSLSLQPGGRERRQRPPERGRGGSNETMVKQYKAHFSYIILRNEKNIYTQHQNMKTIVSSPAEYHVGDYVTRLLSNMVTKSAWVQQRDCTEANWGVQTGKISQNQELMEKRPGRGKRYKIKRIKIVVLIIELLQ